MRKQRRNNKTYIIQKEVVFFRKLIFKRTREKLSGIWKRRRSGQINRCDYKKSAKYKVHKRPVSEEYSITKRKQKRNLNADGQSVAVPLMVSYVQLQKSIWKIASTCWYIYMLTYKNSRVQIFKYSSNVYIRKEWRHSFRKILYK